jgi:hypothetical protein
MVVLDGPPGPAKRLWDSDDLVRIEIEVALATPGVHVVPVLVNGSTMPQPEQLPETIRAICSLHAAHIRRDPDFRSDITRLIRQLQSLGVAGRSIVQDVDPPPTALRQSIEKELTEADLIGTEWRIKYDRGYKDVWLGAGGKAVWRPDGFFEKMFRHPAIWNYNQGELYIQYAADSESLKNPKILFCFRLKLVGEKWIGTDNSHWSSGDISSNDVFAERVKL